MSASPVARQATQIQSIPSKRIIITDSSQLPIDYSSTPGGTLYSTTPGGSRIVYERSTLMFLRNSPLSQTPPNIPDCPPYLYKGSGDMKPKRENGRKSPQKKCSRIVYDTTTLLSIRNAPLSQRMPTVDCTIVKKNDILDSNIIVYDRDKLLALRDTPLARQIPQIDCKKIIADRRTSSSVVVNTDTKLDDTDRKISSKNLIVYDRAALVSLRYTPLSQRVPNVKCSVVNVKENIYKNLISSSLGPNISLRPPVSLFH